jgi:hypothetical protein
MGSTPLTTPPTRRALGADSSYAREKTNDAIGNLNIAVSALQTLVGEGSANSDAIDGNLSFGNLSAGEVQGNLKTELIQGTGPAANTAFTLSHTLGKIPNGAILVQSNVAASLYGSASGNGWTDTTITLLLNEASVDYTILVI